MICLPSDRQHATVTSEAGARDRTGKVMEEFSGGGIENSHHTALIVLHGGNDRFTIRAKPRLGDEPPNALWGTDSTASQIQRMQDLNRGGIE